MELTITKTLRKLSEVFIVIETNLTTNQSSIVFVETNRLDAEEDIERFCDSKNTNLMFHIQIEKLYSDGIAWVESLEQ